MLNHVTYSLGGYQVPLPAGPCSLEDFSGVLLSALKCEESLHGRKSSILAELSEKNLRLLIDMAFYSSMAPEEGRYPRFKIAFRSARVERAVRFMPVVLNQTDDLRKLAPVCAPGTALVVSEREEHLYCDGLAFVSQPDTLPGKCFFNAVLGAPWTLLLDLKGPGHLAADTGFLQYEFRAGSIRQSSFIVFVPGVSRFLDQFREYISQEVAQRFGDCTKTSSDVYPYSSTNQVHAGILNALLTHGGSSPIHVVVSTMLRVVVEARHGGALVIIPSDVDQTNSYKIELGYSTQGLDLGHDLIEFLCASAAAELERPDYDHPALNRWSFWKAKMLTDAEALGYSSSVDGCVVLNRRMQVCRFGGKIRVSDDDAKNAPRSFVNAKTGDKIEYDAFMKGIGGTRHQSAARLCKTFDGVLVFVVSQDGDLTVFSSDASTVTGFRCVLPFDL